MGNSFFDKLKKGMGIEGGQEGEPKQIEEIKGAEEKPKKSRKVTVSKSSEPKRKKTPIVEKTTEEERIKEEPAPLKELKMEVKAPEPKEEIEIIQPVYQEPDPIGTVKQSKLEKESKKKEERPAFEEPAGQPLIDVYQTEIDLIIQSAIAGVKAENLEISIERDVVSIKGNRKKPFEEEGDYFTQECYWGPIARQIIMPVEVDPDRAEAAMKEGVLTIRIPKILREKKRTIKVRI